MRLLILGRLVPNPYTTPFQLRQAVLDGQVKRVYAGGVPIVLELDDPARRRAQVASLNPQADWGEKVAGPRDKRVICKQVGNEKRLRGLIRRRFIDSGRSLRGTSIPLVVRALDTHGS